jgi:hypothetical protein
MKSLTVGGGSSMGLYSNMKNSLVFALLMLLAVSCGENGGNAPGVIAGGSGDECGGTLVGGFCWYISGVSASCTTTCASHGGYNEGTRTFAGSDGSLANCRAVADAIGAIAVNSQSDINFPPSGVGCTHDSGSLSIYRFAGDATNESSTISGGYRYCACNE